MLYFTGKKMISTGGLTDSQDIPSMEEGGPSSRWKTVAEKILKPFSHAPFLPKRYIQNNSNNTNTFSFVFNILLKNTFQMERLFERHNWISYGSSNNWRNRSCFSSNTCNNSRTTTTKKSTRSM